MHELVQQQIEQTHVHVSASATATAAAPRLVEPIEEPFDPSAALEMSDAVRDEVGKLVQKLFLAQQGPKRVVFAATEPGTGCSWMTARVAESLAAQGRGSVCVVDCNLRAPGVHQQFGSENHHGLSDALNGTGPIRDYTTRWSQHLWYVSCGAAAEAGQAMLGSDRMRQRLAELKTVFDFVLIDAAPLNTCNDAVVLGGLTDGVVLVLKANTSRRETARRALHELQSANVRTLGAVLNQRTFPIPEKIYRKL